MHPIVQVICLLVCFGFFFVLGIFLGSSKTHEDPENIEEALGIAVQFLILYHLQPDKVDEKEVREFLEAIGEIEEIQEN